MFSPRFFCFHVYKKTFVLSLQLIFRASSQTVAAAFCSQRKTALLIFLWSARKTHTGLVITGAGFAEPVRLIARRLRLRAASGTRTSPGARAQRGRKCAADRAGSGSLNVEMNYESLCVMANFR